MLVQRLDAWYSYKRTFDEYWNSEYEEGDGSSHGGGGPIIQDPDVQACLMELGEINPLEHHMFHTLPIYYRVFNKVYFF